MAEEIYPKNILMIGPTGVGKTEIARRLAKLAHAPFVKVEATKFTEVGYVGRDVESIMRDLIEIGGRHGAGGDAREVVRPGRGRAEERLLLLLVPPPTTRASPQTADPKETREKFRERCAPARSTTARSRSRSTRKPPGLEMFTPQGVEEVGVNLKDLMPGMFGRTRKRKTSVAEARQLLASKEAEKLIDRGKVAQEARERVEQAGIVFLDEIDKVAGREQGRGPDVSREGVQRDLLPIVEGTTVSTKHGPVKTDHILFIAAGAFHVAKPSDLIPELQGRFPIRVELDPLTESDFVRILTEPENALTKQYAALLSTEAVTLSFTSDAVAEFARLAVEVNSRHENIGARRLATLMERLLEEVSFEAPAMAGVAVAVDAAIVRRTLAGIVRDDDLSRYVL